MELLDRFCEATHREWFYRAMWKALLMSPSVRLPALNYLLAKMPKITSSEGTTKKPQKYL